MSVLGKVGNALKKVLPDYMLYDPRVLPVDVTQRNSEHAVHVANLERRSREEAMGNIAVKATEQNQ